MGAETYIVSVFIPFGYCCTLSLCLQGMMVARIVKCLVALSMVYYPNCAPDYGFFMECLCLLTHDTEIDHWTYFMFDSMFYLLDVWAMAFIS